MIWLLRKMMDDIFFPIFIKTLLLKKIYHVDFLVSLVSKVILGCEESNYDKLVISQL